MDKEWISRGIDIEIDADTGIEKMKQHIEKKKQYSWYYSMRAMLQEWKIKSINR